ncbi:MAG: 3'-5' exonuclease [Gammaproteobacteria bacterium]
MTPVLVFDLETIPDARGLRAVWGIDAGLSDAEVIEIALERRREKTGGSDFLPLHLHRVVAIGCLLRDERGIHLRCLGAPEDDEASLIQQFFALVDRYTPQLVTWNGGGFDLQVLHYRGLVHAVQAPRYWETGDDDRDFRWNNYLSRYHSRHLDLMDLLALYSSRANAPLDELARLCGFPGKLGIDGSQVWPAFRDGRIVQIRDYCETDVANTWLMYCRFQLMRGVLSPERYAGEVALLREKLGTLVEGGAAHWSEFLDAWPTT